MDGPTAWIRWLGIGAVALGGACGTTDDLVGTNRLDANGQGGQAAHGGRDGSAGAVTEPDAGGAAGAAGERSYPNLFAELLGKTEEEITAKLSADFQQLFHGDPATEAIYVDVDDRRAYVWDPREMEVRADGFSNALLVAVQLDQRVEFDKLWRWADAHIVPRTGPLRDFMRWRCQLDGSSCAAAVIAEPHFAATTALWLADGRWGSASGDVDYATEARRLMAATFRTPAGEQTELGELTGLVDESRRLPRSTPYVSDQSSTTSSTMQPAYFALWAEKTAEPRAQELARNARGFWQLIANPETGLVPDGVSLDAAAPSEDIFSPSCYPVPLAMALDAVWFGTSRWQTQEANLLLAFFRLARADDGYSASYTLAGEPGARLGDTLSLEAPLSAVALAATVAYRKDFVQEVWDAQLNTGTSRKFGNLLYMMSALVLSGRFQVY